MTPPAKLWKFRFLFCLGLYFIVTSSFSPLFLLPDPIPSPDLIFCFTTAWLVRRPDYVLTLAVIFATLLNELFIFHSPGLWCAIMLLMTEYFRVNCERIRILPFWNEWSIIALIYAGAQTIYQLILVFIFLPSAPFSQAALHILITSLAYPVAVFITNVFFRVTKTRSELPMFHRPSTFGETN